MYCAGCKIMAEPNCNRLLYGGPVPPGQVLSNAPIDALQPTLGVAMQVLCRASLAVPAFCVCGQLRRAFAMVRTNLGLPAVALSVIAAATCTVGWHQAP